MKADDGDEIQNQEPWVGGLGRKTACICLSVLMGASPLAARELADLSIEELLNESVTSVSKREQKLGDVAAAITVLSNDDLHRSGVTTIADALRLVPGMNVGAVNASQWAISSRGFNNLYANKLLVLMDGRAVYTPLFAGVYWDMQQPMLDDVDRVEVIRGPGATVWGANAVNGVINVVSRSAKDTQGSLVFGGGGHGLEALGGMRYGGRTGENTYYRVFARYESVDAHPLANGESAGDEWQRWNGGFRVDHYPDSSTHLTWQGDASRNLLDRGTSDATGFNTLGRWTRDLGGNSSMEAQVYVDRVQRNESLRNGSTIDTIDFEFQHTVEASDRHTVIWGAGYRYIDVALNQTMPMLPILTSDLKLNLVSAFVQDELRLVPDKFTVTGGFKIEHNDFTGFEIQPSLRAVLKLSDRQTLWGAVSRAVRTPSGLEGKNLFGGELGPPMPGPDGNLYLVAIRGNGNPDSEILWAYEAGWRAQPTRRLSVDLSLFYNRYSDQITLGTMPSKITPGVPFGVVEFTYMNALSATTYGGELSVTFSPVDHWRLSAARSLLLVDAAGLPSSVQYDPKHQTLLRSSHDLGKFGVELQVRHVGEFDEFTYAVPATVAAYTAFDARLSYHLGEQWEFSLVGQNLLDSQHREQGVTIYAIMSEVPRRVFAKAVWSF